MAPKDKKPEKPPAKPKQPAKRVPKADPEVVKNKKIFFGCMITTILCLTAIVLCCLKMTKLKKKEDVLYKPFNELRASAATTFEDDELRIKQPRALADEILILIPQLDKDDVHFAEMQNQYRELFYTLVRPDSATNPWQHHAGYLYYFSLEDKAWNSAETYCNENGAHLAVVTSDSEQQFLTTQITQSTWIGLRKRDNKWLWSNGNAILKEFFNKDQPEDDKVDEDCVIIAPGLAPQNWIKRDCFRLFRFVCMKAMS